jgi:uncharacterized protein YcfL
VKKFSTLFVALMLIGCQAAPEVWFNHKTLLYDQGFVGFENVSVESEKEIFKLNDEAKYFAKSTIKGVLRPKEHIQALF